MGTLTPTIALVPVGTPIPTTYNGSTIAKLDPWMILLIVLFSLLALMTALFLVYWYINNIRTTDVHRRLLRDAVMDSRYRRLLRQAGLEESFRFPTWEYPDWEEPEQLQQLREQERKRLEMLTAMAQELRQRGELSEEERADLQQLEWEMEQIGKELSGRLREERIAELRRQREKLEAEHKAKLRQIYEQAVQEAESLVPASLTVAGMGINAAFFIELTAVLTIIFGVIILGLVGVLESGQIGPILAAVAGFVLGKAAVQRPGPAQPHLPPMSEERD